MRTMTLQQLEESIERRKAALGLTGNNYVRRNSGLNRTPEKRALLQALADLAAEQGRRPPFEPEE